MKKELEDLYVAAMELYDGDDEEGALRLFRQGADLGDDNAMNMVGLAYDSGNVVEQDKAKAIEWLKKSWRIGKKIYVCNNIAKTYSEMGQRRKALYWWNKSIAGGDVGAGLEMAQFLLQKGTGRASERIMSLVQAAADAEGHVEISEYQQEEAQELLEKLRADSNPQHISTAI
ncbi:sel1 repeat family protein [bacterium]|nr:MAG: sel1 repeat family protein [bacterium]